MDCGAAMKLVGSMTTVGGKAEGVASGCISQL